MKKLFYLFNILIVLLLVGSIIAAGTSTSATSDNDNSNDNSDTTDTVSETSSDDVNDTEENDDSNNKSSNKTRGLKRPVPLTDEEKEDLRAACEDSDSRRDRIKCRLNYIKDNKEGFRAPYGVLPEACRKLGDKDRCVKLYDKSQTCYEKKGMDKNKCFKRVAGFARAKLKDENPSGRGDKARDYVVLLLYDLQGKIEEAIENERIDADKGAEVIDKIVEIKEAILNGMTKGEIRPMFQSLKNMLKDIKQTMDQE